MHASSARSWVHEWFHSKHDATGDYRFCRVCWDELPAIAELQKAMLESTPLSLQYSGVVKAERSSTSGMVNHMKQQHKELLPEGLQQEASSGRRPMKVDPEVSRKWSEHMCLTALVPVRTVEHARKVFSSLPCFFSTTWVSGLSMLLWLCRSASVALRAGSFRRGRIGWKGSAPCTITVSVRSRIQ